MAKAKPLQSKRENHQRRLEKRAISAVNKFAREKRAKMAARAMKKAKPKKKQTKAKKKQTKAKVKKPRLNSVVATTRNAWAYLVTLERMLIQFFGESTGPGRQQIRKDFKDLRQAYRRLDYKDGKEQATEQFDEIKRRYHYYITYPTIRVSNETLRAKRNVMV